RSFKQKDLCGRCSYLLQYLKDVEHWDMAQHETLKRIATFNNLNGDGAIPCITGMSRKDFAVFKCNHIQQLKAGLTSLRVREAKRSGASSVDGLTIEHKFRDILRFVRLRNKYDRCERVFYGIATMIDHTFNRKQRRILYTLLDDIE